MESTNNILQDMRSALINAHNSNNAKAISKDFAAGSGVSEKSYTSWTNWCDNLYYKLAPWAEKYNDAKIPDAELNQFLDDAMPILKVMTKVDDKLFVRANDAIFLVGKVHDFGKSADGTLDVVRGKVAFRRQVEAMLGCRIAGNAAVTEADYDTVVKYEKAEANIDKAQLRLDGYTNAKGEKVVGLKERLEEATKVCNDMKKIAGITDEIEKKLKKEKKQLDEAYPLIAAYIQAAAEAEEAVKSAEGQITKCKETMAKLGKKYKEIMAAHPTIKTK